jgi:hypothetical protein
MKNRTSPAARGQRSRGLPRLGWSAAAGLAAAAAVTAFVDTVRHAALIKGAAQPVAGGQKLSPGFILACDFAVTWVIVTAIVFIAAVAAARRARRVTRQDGVPAARRGRRRAAARGW